MKKRDDIGDAIAITPAEAGRILRVSTRRVYQLIRTAGLPWCRLDDERSDIRIPRRQLEAWVLDRAAASRAQEEARSA